jgi:hypothetical protein
MIAFDTVPTLNGPYFLDKERPGRVEQREKGRVMPRDDEQSQPRRNMKARTGEPRPLSITSDRQKSRLPPPPRTDEAFDEGYAEMPRKNSSIRYTNSYNTNSYNATSTNLPRSTNAPIRRQTGSWDPETYSASRQSASPDPEPYFIDRKARSRDPDYLDDRETVPGAFDDYGTGAGRRSSPRDSDAGTGRKTGPRDPDPGTGRKTGPRDPNLGTGRKTGPRDPDPGTGRKTGPRDPDPGTGRLTGSRNADYTAGRRTIDSRDSDYDTGYQTTRNISPRKTQDATRNLPPNRNRNYPRNAPPVKLQDRSRRRVHWFLPIGVGMIAMIALWLIGSNVIGWGTQVYNNLHYGYPRTYQVDAVVGHNHDSIGHPSHFIAINMNRQAVVIEIMAGDVQKSITYVAPVVIAGDGGDLAPVTIEFRDVTGDRLPDMILHIHLPKQDEVSIFVNDGTKFRPSNNNDKIHL